MREAGTSTRRGADVLVAALERCGVTRVFTLSGNHIMPVFDALFSTGIEIVHVRQEAACVHMADAWGRLTGEVGVALVTGGQGHSNGAAALFTAMAAESPVLLLSGHAGLREIGRGAFQELAQADLARPMCKASWTASSVATLADDLVRAMRIAREGRPGPVHLSLPVDLLEQEVTGSTIMAEVAPSEIEGRTAAATLIEAMARHLGEAERPLIVCGPALCTEPGRRAMRELEERSGVPVVGMESPRGLADPALGCLAAIVGQADLLVLVGKALDFTLKFGTPPSVSSSCGFMVVDPDASLVARASRAHPDRLLASGEADARPVLAQLAERLSAAGRATAWRDHVRDALTYELPEWRDAAGSPGRLHPVELCCEVGAFLDRHPGGTLICDGGEIGQWPQALIKTSRRLINGVSGTIGASIPFAIAAKLLSPDRPVVAVLGDGTFGFHMAEFDTAVRYGLPIIAVVGNDARWNAEYQIQLRSYGIERARHCDLLPTRYDEVVVALGGFGALATTPAELSDALERAHASGKPACINVMIDGVPAPTIRRPATS